MPKALSWRELIRKLKIIGFQGPEWGGRHPFVVRGEFKLHIPSDHHADISTGLVNEIRKQTGITTKDWNKL